MKDPWEYIQRPHLSPVHEEVGPPATSLLNGGRVDFFSRKVYWVLELSGLLRRTWVHFW